MGLRRLLGAVAVGTGATLAANAGLRRDGLEPPLEGDARTWRWHGIDVEYAVAGDEDDPTLVLLHGVNAAGSSGEFRELVSRLSERYRVVAPDLPGFGRSDRPPLRYSARFYEAFVGAFLAEFDAPRVLASSLTSAYVVGALDGADADVEVSALALVCPTARTVGRRRLWLRELLRSPVVGEALFNLLASKPSIAHFNADHGYYDPALPDADWAAYEWETAHQPGARYAPASFVAGYLDSEVDLASALAETDVPVTLFWGREADITPLSAGRDLADATGAKLVVFDDARLLPHVEHGERFADALAAELAR
jgi:pimeloyl-ACP methyl ester carboxylesterase